METLNMSAAPAPGGDAMTTVPVDQSQLGPAMRALPNDMWRAAAVAVFEGRPGHGSKVAAVRAAGFEGDPKTLTYTARRLFTDPRMLEALAELGTKYLKAGVPDAIGVVMEVMSDPLHKDRLKAANAILERSHPTVQKHELAVEMKVDHTAEAVAELRHYLNLGVPREKLEKYFGYTGLQRYEKLLALEDKTAPPPIDAEYRVIEPEPTQSTEGLEDIL